MYLFQILYIVLMIDFCFAINLVNQGCNSGMITSISLYLFYHRLLNKMENRMQRNIMEKKGAKKRLLW